MLLKSKEEIVRCLVKFDANANLDTLPEVKAMRMLLIEKPDIDRDLVAKFSIAAALNNYQEFIPQDPAKDSYWGRFVHWTLNDGQENLSPWKRFHEVKQRRFFKFRNSRLWSMHLLRFDSIKLLNSLSDIMCQSPTSKTICFAPLVLARWAYVIGYPFVVADSYPLPIDSRIQSLLQKFPSLDPQSLIQTVNIERRLTESRLLTMSDFDAWAWQNKI